ncbi:MULTISPECIES: hypothetical protein [Microbacterium]|uniref:hypothetical protein n=1 Tax=Microbacterium TaxID=33882 RepID=UPI0012B95FAD|nr:MULTISPECIES: hypothetical protein [Microbacterium]MTE23713.1 hypothetical protein [Microbacterium sp. ZXX196]NHI16925.1 hypothetical protein [Microbacterium excoecariae]
MPNIAIELGKLSGSFGVKASYGEQQDLDGVTVLPVAATWAGYGGGSDDNGQGGGGGGGFSLPVGAYIRRGSEFRFAPNPVTLIAVLTPLVCVTGRALGYVIKRLKK